MSRRNAQLESSMQRVIGSILANGLADPRVRGLVSVTGINVSPDRRNAMVLISVLPEKRERAVLSGLRHAAGRIRSQASSQLRIRSVPRLSFELDESLKVQARIFDAIREAQDIEAQTKGVTPPPESES